MALTERTRPYETLIRHNANGPVGAHHQTITEILRDGAVVSASVNPPVTVVDQGLDDLLSQTLTAALSQITNLQSIVATQESELIKAKARIAELESSTKGA